MRTSALLRRLAVPLGLSLAIVAVAASRPVGAPPGEPQGIKEADQKTLANGLKRYFQALGSPKELEKARVDLREELEKVGKRLAGKEGDALQTALAQTPDLGRVVFQAYGYKNLRGGGKVEGRKAPGRDASIGYALWSPADYKATTGAWPLLLMVPDTKDGKPIRGDQFLTEFWIEKELRDHAVIAAVDMPEDPETWDDLFIEVDGTRISGGLSYLMTVFKDVRENYAIDSERVYLVGRGAGVAVAMKLGSFFPQNFAGVIGRAGDAGQVTWENFQNLPVLLLGAGAQATEFEQQTRAAGYANTKLEPEADGGAIWTWIQDHPRIANPAKVTLVPGSPIPSKAYWLEVPPTDVEPGTYVKAEADPATNTIKVEGQGVRGVRLYLHDLLVDLDKPVKIVLNGQEQQTMIPRSLDDFLDLLVKGTSDAGRPYVAFRGFDLPE